jgi:dolichyl-phosphate-mannose--protein O-mannosyl transferase
LNEKNVCFRNYFQYNRSPIKCDSIVRIIHVTTKRYLHSHDFASPLSHNQEVSAYGEDGAGDEGDRWKVVCTSRNDYWLRKDGIRLQHVVTGK